MTEQLKLDDFKLPSLVLDEDQFDYSPNARVICGECGVAMAKQGPKNSQYNRSNDVIGTWMYSCRAGRHGSAVVVVKEDGEIDYYPDLGSGHKIVDSELEKVEEVGFVYPEYKDPSMWEEPEDE